MMISKSLKQKMRMRRLQRKLRPGIPPGTIEPAPDAIKPDIHVIGFNEDNYTEEKIRNPAEIKQYLNKWNVTWIQVVGLGNANIISQIGDMFDLHRLALEDVINGGQRAKVEQYQNQIFIVGRVLTMDDGVETEQLSLFLGDNYVLTFQDYPEECLEPVRQRIREKRGRVRYAGADYLAYCLLDSVADYYFPLLEKYDERLENIEHQVLRGEEERAMESIYEIKGDIRTLRRAIWPMQGAVERLLHEQTSLICETTHLYLRDLQDHVSRLVAMVELLQEFGSDLRDFHLSNLSNRMNEVMKVLTVIATIFIPLTFIAGLYGMNFNPEVSPWNLPELNWYYGYPFALGIMVAIAVALLMFFRRKNWL